VVAVLGLQGSSWKVSLNVGREPGTRFMPAGWAASGARLGLPLTVTFTDEPVKQGLFKREDGLDSEGGIRRVECSGGSFIGRNGEVKVKVNGGAWSAAPKGAYGQRILRFYLDFPEEVVRNDASIPAGTRVFFAASLWDGEAVEERLAGEKQKEAATQHLAAFTDELRAVISERSTDAPPPFFSPDASAFFFEKVKNMKQDLGHTRKAQKLMKNLLYYKSVLPNPDECVEGKGGMQLEKEGTLVIKCNDIRNGFGFFADFFSSLGSFKMAALPYTQPEETSGAAARSAAGAAAVDEPCVQGEQEPCLLPA
jgi:hypothetical protein